MLALLTLVKGPEAVICGVVNLPSYGPGDSLQASHALCLVLARQQQQQGKKQCQHCELSSYSTGCDTL